ncbi:MAG: hypothetical protein ACJ78V_19495, partial [Myxococcales bacterium]
MFGIHVMVGNSISIEVDLLISRKRVRRESEQLQNEENAHQPQRDEIREVPPLVEELPEAHLDHRAALRAKHNLHVRRPQSTVPALPDRHARCQSIDRTMFNGPASARLQNSADSSSTMAPDEAQLLRAREPLDLVLPAKCRGAVGHFLRPRED